MAQTAMTTLAWRMYQLGVDTWQQYYILRMCQLELVTCEVVA